jgi:hypothetical protein
MASSEEYEDAFGDQGGFLKKAPLEPQKLLGKLFAEFLSVLFYLNGAVCHVGPLPHRIEG